MERRYGAIEIPVKAFEHEDVRQAATEAFGNCDWEVDAAKARGAKIVNFSDNQARYGAFRDVEEALVKNNIPFDRYSEGYYETPSVDRCFRPRDDNEKNGTRRQGSIGGCIAFDEWVS